MNTTSAPAGPILGLSEPIVRILRIVAFGWSLLAIGTLVLATEFDLLHYRPGGDAYAIPEQQVFGLGFVIAVILAWKWEILGGTFAGMTAAALLVFARQQLAPIDGTLVIVAFAVPGALWVLIDLHDLRPRMAITALGLIAVAVVSGATIAGSVYDDLFGPSHPESSLPALPDSEVQWVLIGAVTHSSAEVTGKLDHSVKRIRLALHSDPSNQQPRWVEPTQFDSDGVARFVLDALESDTEYHFAIEADGATDAAGTGTFMTFPREPASFSIAVGACARVGTNGAVFDAIRERQPDLFLISGDLSYANIDVNDPDKFRDILDHQLSQTAPSALFRSTPVAYVWDDHDYGANNADATTPSRPAAMEVYRQYFPHYRLAGAESPIYQAFTIGRVRVIITDTRSARSPSLAPDDGSKTMLGEAQKAWFKAQLLAANDAYPLILWVNSVPWIAAATPGGDDWGGYTTERTELADFIADNDIDGLLMVSGDAHMIAIDDGTNSDYSTSSAGGFPVFHAAALDRPGHAKGGPYSHGTYPGSGQFGLLSVTDDGGDTIAVELSGRTWEDIELVNYQFTVVASR